MAHKATLTVPETFVKRLAERARHHSRLVVTVRDGRPSRVFGFEEYVSKQASASETKPWKHRQKLQAPDPLRAVKGTVKSRLSRSEIYD